MHSSLTATALPAPTGSGDLLQRCVGLVGDDLVESERELGRLLQSSIAIIPDVGGHLAFAGGKRFRPLLTLLCARAAGMHDASRITVAAVGELLHTATLLHDDVIDGGEFRRGRPAARMHYGNGMAVLTGDYCLARALQAMAATGPLDAVRSMSETVTRMAEGEVAQLHNAGDVDLDHERYNLVIERKTATLIAWCSEVAGLVDARYRVALRQFGLELGYAFQIADDLLDYQSDSDRIGKEPGQDVREGKMTLPLILACSEDATLRDEVEAALRAGPPMPNAIARSIVRRVARSEAIAKTTAIALRHADTALAALRVLPDTPARRALEAVCDYVVRRSR
jgi:octaprenyl-diphosphate synthase